MRFAREVVRRFRARFWKNRRNNRKRSLAQTFEALERRYVLLPTDATLFDISHCNCTCNCVGTVPDSDASVQIAAGVFGPTSLHHNSAADAVAIAFQDELSADVEDATYIEVQWTFNSVAQPTKFYDASAAMPDDLVQYGMVANTSALPAGPVAWSATVIEHNPIDGNSTRNYSGVQEVKKSAYAGLPAGWSLVGMDRLVIDGSGVSEARGEGNSYRFDGTTGSGFTRRAGERDLSALTWNGGSSTYTRKGKDGNSAVYNASGLLTKRIDRSGNETLYSYIDADGDSQTDDIFQITEPGGFVTEFTYTASKLTSIEDHAGRVTTLGYTGALLTSVTHPDPGASGDPLVVTYAYDSGRLREIDRGGEVTQYTYDARGFVTQRDNADGSEEFFGNIVYLGVPASGTGTSSGNLADLFYVENAEATFTDTAGEDRTYRIDRFGNITKETDALGNVTTYVRNAEGLVTSMTTPDPDGAGALSAMTTSYTYDIYFNLTEIEYPDSTTEAWTWDTTHHVPLSFTDRHGHETFYTLDGSGRVLTERRVVGEVDDEINEETNNVVTTYTYTDGDGEPAGLVETIVDALGIVTFYDYDAAGNVVEIVYADGTALEAFVYYAYNADNLLETFTDELGRVTTYVYDDLGQLIELTLPDPDGSGGGNPLASPVWQYEYDTLGRMVLQIDPLLRETQYVYNASGQLWKIITPDHDGDTNDTVTEFAYDAAGRMDETIDALLRSHAVVFDELGRAIERHEPSPDGIAAGPVFKTSYGATGWVLSTTDPLNNKTLYEYANFGRTITTILPDPLTGVAGDGPESVAEYDAVGNLIESTDANGGVTTYEYDELNRLVQMTLPDPTDDATANPPVYVYAYDKLGRLLTTTDPLGNVTTNTYDARGRLLTVTLADPDGPGGGNPLTAPQTDYGYDGAGQLISVIDALANETTYDYDHLGRLILMVQPDPDGGGPLGTQSTTYAYDAVGNLILVTDPLGNFTAYDYDEHNNLVEITLPDPDDGGGLASPVWTFTYDDLGNKLTSTDPLSRVTTYEYDGLNRLKRETSPDPDGGGGLLAARVDTTYDLANNVLTVTDRLSHATTYVYDHLHRLTSHENANSEVTSFTFDAIGNRLTLTDPELNTTTWVYDALNRVIEETNELSDTRYFEYDNASNLTEKTDRLGRVTQYSYDDLHRRTAEIWKNGGSTVRTLTFAYDALGQLVNADDPAAEYDYTYDPLGRLTEIVADLNSLTDDVTFAQTFDGVGNRIELDATIGSTADFLNTYTFDDLYRLTQLKQDNQSGGSAVLEKRFDFTYNAASQFSTIKRYADLTTSELVVTSTYSYDSAGRLASLVHADATPTQLAGYDFTYDAANRITSIDSFLDDVSDFTYDDASQLTDADHDTQTDEAYEYDDNGNRVMIDHTVGDNNQLLSDGTYDYEYDAEGNRIRRTRISDDLVEEYHWDHRNRLTSVVTCGGTTDLGYGALGFTEVYGVEYGCGTGFNSTGWGAGNGSGTLEFDAVPTGLRISSAAQTYFTVELISGEEGESGSLQMHRIAGFGFSGVLNVTVTGITANIGSDLSGLSTATIPFGAWDIDSWVYFSMVDDGSDEGHETFSVSVGTTASGITTPTTTVEGMVYDNDGTAETLSFSIPYSVSVEPTSEASLSGTAVFTFEEPVPVPLQFNVTTRSVTATYVDDFDDITGSTVNVAQNEVSAEWEFEVIDDVPTEYNESFEVTFTSADDATSVVALEALILDGESTLPGSPLPIAARAVRYAYDTFDRLVEREYREVTVGETKEAYIYDGNQVALRFVDGEIADRYVWGPAVDQLLADEQIGVSSSEVIWPVGDHLGTLRDLLKYNAGTNATTNGNHREYDSFGNRVDESNAAVDLLFGYTGKAYDEATKLQNNVHRWYDPVAGRWVSEDPIGFAAGDSNVRRYVGNSSIGRTDPSGLQGLSVGQWFYVGGAFLYGAGQGVVNIGVGVVNTGQEIALQGADLVVGSVETAGNLAGANWHFETYSQAGQALQSGQVSTGAYYGELGANIATAGTYGQIQTFNQYLNGEITADQASQRIGSTAVFQLLLARALANNPGGIGNVPVQNIPSHLINRCRPTTPSQPPPSQLATRPPLDAHPYSPHPQARPLGADVAPGTYVYVQDANGVVHIAPNGPHAHPSVLGNGAPAAAAGEITVGPNGIVTEINNISGTFQWGPETLPQVEAAVTQQGLTVAPGASRPWTHGW